MVDKDEGLTTAFGGKSLYPSAMVDKESYYPRIKTGDQFTPDEEKDLFQQFNNRTFTQFEDQASIILTVMY